MNAFVQELIVMGIGLCAAGYLIRRWWPALKGLWQNPAPSNSHAASCGTGPAQGAPNGSCQSGCGQCGGAGATPRKDHREQVVKLSRVKVSRHQG